MNFRLNYVLILSLSLVCFTSIPSFAKSSRNSDRNDVIEKKLSCFSDHASDKKINWDEVCDTASKKSKSHFGEQMDDKSLDDMVKEHEDLADEMLSDSVTGEVITEKSVDDVVEKVNKDNENNRTVDDVIKEQGVKNDFTPQLDDALVKNYSDDQQVKETEAVQLKNNTSDTKELEKKKNIKRDSIPDLFDEPKLMNDRAKTYTDIEPKKHEFAFDYERYYSEYTEDSVDVKLKGWWNGYTASYSYRPAEGNLLFWNWINYYSLEGRFATAKLDYTSGGTGSDENEPNYMYEVRSIVGRDFYPVSKLRITPYGGFGFRYLLDDSGGRQTTTGQYGYDRKSHYFYLPFGLNYAYQINDDWRVVANGEYDIFLSGWQKSYLSDVPVSGYFDVRNDQKHGFGLRASVKIVRIFPLVNVSVEPFVRYWHIQDSEVSNAGSFDGMEPENKTIEAGLKAGVQF